MSSEETPDASQWLTLLGMGTSAAAGSSGIITRTLHKMLEGAAAVDLTGWTAETCRHKWLAYLEQLRPLVEQAEAAQAAYRAAQGSSSGGDQDGGVVQQQPQRRPQRAAAAAAVAVIKQEAADILGVAPLPVCPVASHIPDVPVAQQHHAAGHNSNHASSSKSPGSSPNPQLPGAGGEEASAGGCDGASTARAMEGVQQQRQPNSSCCSPSAAHAAAGAASEHSAGSITGSELSHGPNVEGIPAAVLAKIEDLVMLNFYWLLAIMTRNPLLTYEFISMDLVEGRSPLPPQQDKMWGEAVNRIELTLEQKQECCTCLQVGGRRHASTASMQTGSPLCIHACCGMA